MSDDGLVRTKSVVRCLWPKCEINLISFSIKAAYGPAKLQPVNQLFFEFGVMGQVFVFTTITQRPNFQVSKERGEELAIEYGIKFMETSAKASINVEEAFFTLARDIKAKMEKKLVRLLSSFLLSLYYLYSTLLSSSSLSNEIFALQQVMFRALISSV